MRALVFLFVTALFASAVIAKAQEQFGATAIPDYICTLEARDIISREKPDRLAGWEAQCGDQFEEGKNPSDNGSEDSSSEPDEENSDQTDTSESGDNTETDAEDEEDLQIVADLRAKNYAAYKEAMRKGEAAVARGDLSAAVAAYEEANARRPSAETENRLRAARAGAAVSNAGRAIVDAYLEHEKKEAKQRAEARNADRAGIHARAEQLKRQLDAQNIYLKYHAHLLTGLEGRYIPGESSVRSDIDQKDIVYAIESQLRVQAQLADDQRTDSLYVFAVRFEKGGTRSRFAIARELQEALQYRILTNPADHFDPPTLHVKLTNVVSIPVNEKTLIDPAVTQRSVKDGIGEILQKYGGLSEDFLLIATSTQTSAEALRQSLASANIPGMTLEHQSIRYALDNYRLEFDSNAASYAERLMANLAGGTSLALKSGSMVFFWEDQYMLLYPAFNGLNPDAEQAFAEVHAFHTDPTKGPLVYTFEVAGQRLMPERILPFNELGIETNFGAGNPGRYMPMVNISPDYFAVPEAVDDLNGNLVNACGPPKTRRPRYLQFGSYTKKGERIKLQPRELVLVLPCMQFTAEFYDTKNGNYQITFSNQIPDEFFLFRGSHNMEFSFDAAVENSFTRKTVYLYETTDDSEYEKDVYRVRNPKYYWLAIDLKRPLSDNTNFSERARHAMDADLVRRGREAGLFPQEIVIDDVWDGGRVVLEVQDSRFWKTSLRALCVRGQTENCGSQPFAKWIAKITQHKATVFGQKYGLVAAPITGGSAITNAKPQ